MVPCDSTNAFTTAFSFFGSAMPSWMISRVATVMCSSSSGSRKLVRFGQERIGEERLRWQAALRTEVGARRVDHHRGAAGIHLDARQVREVLHHGAVDEAGAVGSDSTGTKRKFGRLHCCGTSSM